MVHPSIGTGGQLTWAYPTSTTPNSGRVRRPMTIGWGPSGGLAHHHPLIHPSLPTLSTCSTWSSGCPPPDRRPLGRLATIADSRTRRGGAGCSSLSHLDHESGGPGEPARRTVSGVRPRSPSSRAAARTPVPRRQPPPFNPQTRGARPRSCAAAFHSAASGNGPLRWPRRGP